MRLSSARHVERLTGESPGNRNARLTSGQTRGWTGRWGVFCWCLVPGAWCAGLGAWGLVRFARATGMRAAGSAGVCSAGSPCVGIRPGRPNSAGFHLNSSAQRERAAPKRLGHMPRVPASRRSPSCTNPRPPCRRHRSGGETNTGHVSSIVRLASTGHRGRVDARGHRSGREPGLTRTSGQRVGVPSRDGRCGRLRRPRLAVAAMSARAHAKR